MSFVAVFLADGFEEVEGLTAVDLLRRAQAEVRLVSVMGRREIVGARGIHVTADEIFENMPEGADMLVLPGGLPGTDYLREHEGLAALLKKEYAAGKWLAAICAAPSVFGGLGLLKGKRATSYPGCLPEEQCGAYLEEEVVRDGNVITSRGVGTAIPFALALIEMLKGKAAADAVADSILYRR